MAGWLLLNLFEVMLKKSEKLLDVTDVGVDKTERLPRLLIEKLKKALRNPSTGLQVLGAMIRGTFYIVFYRVVCKDVKIKFPFYVYQRVTIHGPGKVRIGHSCSVYPNNFHGLTVLTVSSKAEVTIGSHCSFGGLTIICDNKITIGKRCMTAFSLVQDTLFYNIKEVKSHYYDQGLASSASIVLGNNSWLCSQSCALQGTSMGDDSVLSTGSVCFQMDIKDYHLCVNNPVIRPLSIDKLQRLKRL